ncbi:MAG TPA: TolC family outer membrane protein [Magnetospirillaceae bacterium]|nr:TolC family outer membrane protein [Magnetospirillaceae bacterium]
MSARFLSRWAALALLAAGSGKAAGESLTDALASAYVSNPQLMAQRSALKVTDEFVPQAQAGWRPTVTVTSYSGMGTFMNNADLPYDSWRRPTSGSVAVSQPIYQGGRTTAAIDQARSTVLAGTAQLTTIEQTVLLGAASAYFDVVRDHALVELSIANQKTLYAQRDAVTERFRARQVTLTDISQAETRASGADFDRTAAEVAEQNSVANYVRIVGRQPDDPSFPATLPATPPTLDALLASAKSDNPQIHSADQLVEAARKGVDLAAGELLPSVSLNADATRNMDTSFPHSANSDREVFLAVTIPLYEAGVSYSHVRQAKLTLEQRQSEAELARVSVVSSATQAWASLQIAGAQVQALQRQVQAAQVAYDSIAEEAKAGRRTVIDMLNAEQDLFTARANLIRARHDQLAAAYTVLSALGQMTALSLDLPVRLYDPGDYYRDADGRWIGWSTEPDRGGTP